ncbi:MAG: hypothetical protein ABR867_06640 [Nitrososphaerales archaeon]|jgi:hypothetical protein
MVGRPRIREKLWEKTVRRALDEGMNPSEVVEDALQSYFEAWVSSQGAKA